MMQQAERLKLEKESPQAHPFVLEKNIIAVFTSLMFFPIILNIAVLTNAVGFQGTWLLTIFMTLAATYLVAWDYDRLKPIFFGKRRGKSHFMKNELVLKNLSIYRRAFQTGPLDRRRQS